jgi:hypothetical protein
VGRLDQFNEELEFLFMGRGRNGIGSLNAACADGAVLSRPEDKRPRGLEADLPEIGGEIDAPGDDRGRDGAP